MSIVLIDLGVFHAVAERLVSPDPREGHFITCFSLEEAKLQSIVKRWYQLNLSTHLALYKDFSVLNNKYMYEKKPFSTMQFLRWLQSIKKNINIDLIELHIHVNDPERYSVVFLDRIIDEVQSKLIDGLANQEGIL